MSRFDILPERRGSSCVKWDRMKPKFGRDDVMPLWIADMDFAIMPEILSAIAERTTEVAGMGYTFPSEEYFGSICKWFDKRQGLQMKKEEILPIPGVVTGVAVVINQLTEVGDSVVINTPVYPLFSAVITKSGRKVVQSPLVCNDGAYTIDFESLEACFKAGAKVYLLCSPHNPVGRVWKEEELRTIIDLCKRYNVILMADEIHGDIIFQGNRQISLLQLDEDAVVVTAPSKAFNITGVKTSMIFVKNEEIRQKIEAGISAFHLEPSIYGYVATAAAYTHGEEWLNELNLYLEENARATVAYFQEHLPAVKAYVPESTYLMWVDFTALGLGEERLQDILINEAKVALNGGSDYGVDYDQFMRLNIGAPREYLMTGIERIVEALKKHI